jgi:fucose 4-O-acetylase-like acetyltransferase
MVIACSAEKPLRRPFFMGLLFLIAGYFVPGAFERKGATRFLHDRVLRLGVPALFYMLVIQPLIVYWLLRNYNKITDPFANAYAGYLVNFRFLGGSGPM